MEKWADHLISAVNYDVDHSFIVKTETRDDRGDKVGEPRIERRADVIANIKNGRIYYTILKGKDGWQRGEKIDIINMDGKEFIRTDRNRTEKDNLGNLPEF